MRALLAALLFALAPSARAQTTYVHLTTREWFTLEPAAAYDAVSLIVTGNVYEPLVAFASVRDPERIIPFIASEVPTSGNGLVSADGTLYTFPIRKGVRFHSGDVLTPEDVRYSLLRFMLHDLRMGSAMLLKPVLGVYSTRGAAVSFREAAAAVRVEGDSVVVRLKRPDAGFLKALASLPIIVCRKWAAEHGEWDGSEASWERFNRRSKRESYFHEHMNGTGPFMLESADRKEGMLALGRHEGYWRAPAALDRVALRVVPNPALRVWMLENGDADGSYFEDRDYYEVRGSSSVRVVDGLPMTSLGETLFFTFSGMFSDRLVREAFARSIDYDGYFSLGMGRRGRRAVGPFPQGILPLEGGPPYPYDPKGAEDLLRKALGGRLWEKGFTVTLAYSPSNVHRVVLAEILAEGLRKINPKFRVLLRAMSSQELSAAAGRHELPLYISSTYPDTPDPQALAFALLYSGGYSARGQRYSDPEMDALFERAAASADPALRRDLFARMSRLAVKDIPQVYLFEPARFRAFHKRVLDSDPDQNISNLGLNNFPYFYTLAK